jgi:hypothetical protein
VTEGKIMDTAAARERFSALRAAGGLVDSNELDEIWAPLPAVRIEDVLAD